MLSSIVSWIQFTGYDVCCLLSPLHFHIPAASLQCNHHLWRCSTGADPVTDPTTLGSVAKVVGSLQKVVLAVTTRRRVGGVFCTASRRSTTTSPKPLTDKLDHKQTSRKDKQTSQERVPDPSRQD